MTQIPEVRLISCTELPVETAVASWIQSRPTQFPKVFSWMKKYDGELKGEPCKVVTARTVKTIVQNFPEVFSVYDLEKTFKEIIRLPLPILESIHFAWGFADMPIEWREQAVRKRQWGFWLTSMREFSMSDFAQDGRYRPPPEGEYSRESIDRLHGMMLVIESFYNELIEKWGWPQEVARKVVPLCATHNGSLFANFRTLKETVSARTCWIAQIEVWRPVLMGMVSELAKVSPLLSQIVSPPCFEMFSDEYKGCKYSTMNENRLTEKDPYAPCPLFVTNEWDASVMTNDSRAHWMQVMDDAKIEEKYIEQGVRLLETWTQIWRRDPFTGALR